MSAEEVAGRGKLYGANLFVRRPPSNHHLRKTGLAVETMLPSIASARSIILQICRPSSAAAKSLVHPLTMQARTFASEVPHTPLVIDPSSPPSKDTSGPLRPHLGIEVNPNHGIYGFFRKKVGDDGEVKYETLEPVDFTHAMSGAYAHITV